MRCKILRLYKNSKSETEILVSGKIQSGALNRLLLESSMQRELNKPEIISGQGQFSVSTKQLRKQTTTA
jgi:hypothetical protein